jgi:hypothetical protein
VILIHLKNKNTELVGRIVGKSKSADIDFYQLVFSPATSGFPSKRNSGAGMFRKPDWEFLNQEG